jgi:hypothetical protein
VSSLSTFPPAAEMQITLQVRLDSGTLEDGETDESVAPQDVSKLSDRRVKRIRPLIPPQILQEDLPVYVLLHLLHCYVVLSRDQNSDSCRNCSPWPSGD